MVVYVHPLSCDLKQRPGLLKGTKKVQVLNCPLWISKIVLSRVSISFLQIFRPQFYLRVHTSAQRKRELEAVVFMLFRKTLKKNLYSQKC